MSTTTTTTTIRVPIAFGSPHFHAVLGPDEFSRRARALGWVEILLPAVPANPSRLGCASPGDVVWRISDAWLSLVGIPQVPSIHWVVCRHQIEID